MKAIIDIEANGMTESSVLSISIIIIDKYLNIVDTANRYYFPVEDFNKEAEKIHGLREKIITDKRIDADYPEHFEDDFGWLFKFFKRYNVSEIIAHNTTFDIKFLPYPLNNLKSFCTMLENTEYVGIENEYGYKWPKLYEACGKYNIEFDESKAHNSFYDAMKTYELYVKTQKRLKK